MSTSFILNVKTNNGQLEYKQLPYYLPVLKMFLKYAVSLT